MYLCDHVQAPILWM